MKQFENALTAGYVGLRCTTAWAIWGEQPSCVQQALAMTSSQHGWVTQLSRHTVTSPAIKAEGSRQPAVAGSFRR